MPLPPHTSPDWSADKQVTLARHILLGAAQGLYCQCAPGPTPHSLPPNPAGPPCGTPPFSPRRPLMLWLLCWLLESPPSPPGSAAAPAASIAPVCVCSPRCASASDPGRLEQLFLELGLSLAPQEQPLTTSPEGLGGQEKMQLPHPEGHWLDFRAACLSLPCPRQAATQATATAQVSRHSLPSSAGATLWVRNQVPSGLPGAPGPAESAQS